MKSASLTLMPGDIRRDPVLRKCSLQARGLWSEIWYLAHEAEPYGSLRIGGDNLLTPEDLVPQVGRPLREVRSAWNELLERRVPVVFESFEQLLAEVRLDELYWLRPRASWSAAGAPRRDLQQPLSFPQAVGEGRGNPVENLRRAEEIVSTTPLHTPAFIAQLPGPSPIGLTEDSLRGLWFVRRMVRDQEKRLNAKQRGELGGNPALRKDKG